MTWSNPLPSGRDFIGDGVSWESFVEELRQQWRLLWRERIDDKVRAEGIANDSFDLLFVCRGTVIYATRGITPLDFREILEQYDAPYEVKIKEEKPHPIVGGWRKFGKEMAAMKRRTKRKRQVEDWNESPKKSQQLKKGGRGWLHTRS